MKQREAIATALEVFDGEVTLDPWAAGLDGALELASKNFKVVCLYALDWPEGAPRPRGCQCSRVTCKVPGNHPRDPDWTAHSTSDLANLEHQFQMISNVGIHLEKSGLCALEIDPRDGFSRLARLKKKHGPLPQTPYIEARPTERRWYLFRLSEPIKSRQVPRYPGLHFHSSDSWIPAPPSKNTKDGVHRWGARGPIADIPPWLLKKVNQ